MDDTTSTATITVLRFKRGDPRGERLESFDVPVGPGTTVLDALLWIRLHRDPGLVLRHSCLHASCGTCGVQVDGREALACVTPVGGAGREILVEPLANLPVLADLAVDMGPFQARMPDGPPPLVRTSELLPGAAVPEGLGAHLRFEDCIECGLCLSACPISSTSASFAGPAALAAAQRRIDEPRGDDPGSLLDWAAGPGGVWSCHAGFECTAACPSGVGPAERIMGLRRAVLGRRRGERNGR